MGQNLHAQQLAKRRSAAKLLAAVLDETLPPRQALNQWPEEGVTTEDSSLQAAYHALWHFEADEDQQQTIPFYLDTQLDLMLQMAQYLAQGRDLPGHLILGYREEPSTRFLNEAHLLWGPLNHLKACWKELKALCRYAERYIQEQALRWRTEIPPTPKTKDPLPLLEEDLKELRSFKN